MLGEFVPIAVEFDWFNLDVTVKARCHQCYTHFTLMRIKPRFYAVLQPPRTAGNRTYAANTVK